MRPVRLVVAFAAPAKTPRNVVSVLNAGVVSAMQSPELR
jgi:hypothetical protein